MRFKIPDHDHPIWGIIGELISYIPVVVALLLITNDWDSEWLVIGALAGTTGGRYIFKNWQKHQRGKSPQEREKND